MPVPQGLTVAEVYVLPKFGPNPYGQYVQVDTTSRGPFKDLSPFYLGPVTLPNDTVCLNFENFWQYSKVYRDHAVLPSNRTNFPWNYEPTVTYWAWRNEGFRKQRAERYPMGKGVKPLYFHYLGRHLQYLDARLQVYIPHYVHLVRQTKSYAQLYNWFCEQKRSLVLLDFDGYDYVAEGLSLHDVAYNPKRKFGHAFVLAMMLKGELP